jgi:hypothetical protein
MKAIRRKPGKIVNPLFSQADKRVAKAQGVPYETPEFLTVPKGELVDDPDCWMLCLGSDPDLQPADKECADVVLRKMTSTGRAAFLANVRRLAQPEVRKQLSKDDLKSLELWLELYGDEIQSPPDLSAVQAIAAGSPSVVAQVPASAPAAAAVAAVPVVVEVPAAPEVSAAAEDESLSVADESADEPEEATELPDVA